MNSVLIWRVFSSHKLNTANAHSRGRPHGPLWQRRSDDLSHGQDYPEPHYNVGLEVLQKETSASDTVNSFTTLAMLLWKLNLGSQIDGVRGIYCKPLQRAMTPFHSAARCNPGWWCEIESRDWAKSEHERGLGEMKSKVLCDWFSTNTQLSTCITWSMRIHTEVGKSFLKAGKNEIQ